MQQNLQKSSGFGEFFKWNWKDMTNEKIIQIRAIIMFCCLLLGYAIFQLSWNSVNQANSTGNGPVATLYPVSVADPTISRVSNWAVTLTRGCTAVLLGLLVNRIGHKNGVIVGFSMMICSLPFVFTPQMKDAMIWQMAPTEVVTKDNLSEWLKTTDGVAAELTASKISYGLFIVFRLFLAVGGTSILIYTAPIVAKFFAAPKARNACTKLGTVPAQFAGIIASLLFVNAATARGIAGQWQVIGGALIGVVALLLIVYLFVGMHFRINDKPKEAQQQLMDTTPIKATSIFKDYRLWILLFGSAFTLYAGIEPASGVLNNLWTRTDSNIGYVWDLQTGIKDATNSLSTWQFVWQILYSVGLYTGLITVARWTNTKYSISRYYSICTAIGVVFFGLSYAMGAISLTASWSIALCLIFCIIGASLIFGVQGLAGIIPYRWKWNVHQITQYTSFSWTYMYLMYSVLDIITAYVGTAGVTANLATYGDLVATDPSLINNADLIYYIAADGTKVTGLDAFMKIQNTMLGGLIDYTPGASLTPVVYNGVTYTLDSSLANIGNQYIPQICVIAILPMLCPAAMIWLKRLPEETPFTFKHFKENHMHFNGTKKLINKIFKTNLEIKEVDTSTI